MFFQLDRHICLIPSLSSRAHRCAWRAFFSPAPAKRNEFPPGRDFQTRRHLWHQSGECSEIRWELLDLPRDEDRSWLLYPAWHSEPPISNRDASRALGDTSHATMTDMRPGPRSAD